MFTKVCGNVNVNLTIPEWNKIQDARFLICDIIMELQDIGLENVEFDDQSQELIKTLESIVEGFDALDDNEKVTVSDDE